MASKDTVDMLIGALQRGATKAGACAAAGMGESTFYRAMEKGEGDDAPAAYREFREAITRAEGQSETLLIGRVFEQSAGDWRAAAWILTHRFPERWGVAAALEGMAEREMRRIAEEFGLTEKQVQAEMSNIVQFSKAR